MDRQRFERTVLMGRDALGTAASTATLISSRLARQAGPAFRQAAQLIRDHAPPAYRRARHALDAAAAGLSVWAQKAAQSALAARAERNRAANPTAPRPSRAARRAWLAQLEEIGPNEVEDLLARTSAPHAGPQDIVRFIDAGIAHGKARYPTRQFILDWLGGDEVPADMTPWRVAAMVVLCVALLSAGMLAAFV